MSACDIYHEHVCDALDKDGWRVTQDPLHLQRGLKDMYVDLGAEDVVAAEREGRKIAVEIKSFVGASELEDMKNAIGQFILYRNVLPKLDPDRELFLAIRQATYEDVFAEPLGKLLTETDGIRLSSARCAALYRIYCRLGVFNKITDVTHRERHHLWRQAGRMPAFPGEAA